MAKGNFNIAIGATNVATTAEVVSFEPKGSSFESMEIAGYGAAQKLFYSLGNVSVKSAANVTKDWDTPEDAWAWYEGGAAALAGVQNMLVTKTCVDGTLVKWLYSGVKITMEVQEPMNGTTIFKINFEGPAPTLQP